MPDMILRIPLDIRVPDSCTNEQATHVVEAVRTYIGSVSGTEAFGRIISELKPEATYHVHRGNEGPCRECQNLAVDGKGVSD